ncbi:MAG: hypothetical protein GF416_00990 [Candidatus Altiarchaeales archaeon]|nr:hypothetical protein [Candidatus Altiarchaeales archaeon]MBD3415692.1 hypothetical protein [Candidatus Altiarchaeales archaeon]
MRYVKIVLAASVLLFLLAFIIHPKHFVPTPAESAYSLMFFFLVSYLLGYSLTKDFFKSDDALESTVMRVGFGLSTIPLLLVLMETFGVPLRWNILMLLSVVRPLHDLFTTPKKFLKYFEKSPSRIMKWSPDHYAVLALLVSAAAFNVAMYGSYTYPYLADGDSWEHAAGVKYISLSGTYTKPDDVYVSHYIRPYPPSYDALLALVHQLNSSVSWTLKTFNNVLVALTYAFAYFMVRRFTGESKTAFYSTLVLFALPPFGSHSIWAHTMAITLLFPVFYGVDMVREDRSWTLLASIFLAGSLIVQPLMSFVIGVFFILYLLGWYMVSRKHLKKLFTVGVLGLALSMIYWAPVALDPEEKGDLGDVSSDLLQGKLQIGLEEEDRSPTAMKMFFPDIHGDMFMQHGFGAATILLTILAFDFAFRRKLRKFTAKKPWFAVMALWLAFTLTFLFSPGLQFSIYPQRFWGTAAIPLAVFSGFMLAHLSELKFIPKKKANYAFAFFILLLLFTSARPKLNVQTTTWGVTDLRTEIGSDFSAYLALKDLPPDTPVYPFCTLDKYVIGFDKLSYAWDDEIEESRADPIHADPETLHTILKSRPRPYEYIIFDYACVKRCMEELSMSKDDCKKAAADNMQAFEDSGLYEMTGRSQSTIAFKVL